MPLFDRITDMLLGAGTEGVSGLTELLTGTLAAEKHAERALACDLVARIWPKLPTGDSKAGLLNSLARFATGHDKIVGRAALQVLGGFGEAAAAVAPHLRAYADLNLPTETKAALKKIEGDKAAKPPDLDEETDDWDLDELGL